MFWVNYTTITDTSVDVQDWYLVITKSGTQVKDWQLARYEVKTKYLVKDGFFIEIKQWETSE